MTESIFSPYTQLIYARRTGLVNLLNTQPFIISIITVRTLAGNTLRTSAKKDPNKKRIFNPHCVVVNICHKMQFHEWTFIEVRTNKACKYIFINTWAQCEYMKQEMLLNGGDHFFPCFVGVSIGFSVIFVFFFFVESFHYNVCEESKRKNRLNLHCIAGYHAGWYTFEIYNNLFAFICTADGYIINTHTNCVIYWESVSIVVARLSARHSKDSVVLSDVNGATGCTS